jgi:hypothetical protein
MMQDHVNVIVWCLDCDQVFNLGEHLDCVGAVARDENQTRLEFDNE